MDEQQEQQPLRTVEIPRAFFSDATDAPFVKCTMCERSLLDGKVPYIIEKAMKRHPEFNYTDTIFEYAICMHCHQRMMQAFSKESKENIAAYFQKHLEMLAFGRGDNNGSDNWNTYMGQCMVKGTSVDELREYQFAGHFIGNELILNEPPMLLSGAAVDEVQDLISDQTRGEIDDFTDKFLGLPPEFKLALKNGELVLV